MQEKHNSIANALELHFSYIDDPSNSLLNTPVSVLCHTYISTWFKYFGKEFANVNMAQS